MIDGAMITIRPARPADAESMARVHIETWRSTYPGIVSAEYLAQLSLERSIALWAKHLSDPAGEITAVAEDEAGRVVGLASGGPPHEPFKNFDAELFVLYILLACQGQGVGRRLVAQVAAGLQEAGHRALIVWVLRDNPARGFYERLGGRLRGEKVIQIGGAPLVDVAYGWDDLSALLESQPASQNDE
jgi:ribosomal protein S18 acetylase RimI-like enzyme